MPVDNVGQPVLLKTDKEAGMALVKSKDGRIKWLTVSADPSSRSWEERVRSWASKLGVCAPPSSTKQNTQNTPMSTPPPYDPQHPHPNPQHPQEQRNHWLSCQTGGAGVAAQDVDAAVPALGAVFSPPPPSTENFKIATKQQARSKRPGSFARGFLLGFGGGGGGGGSGTCRSKSPLKVTQQLDGNAKVPVAPPAYILPHLQPEVEGEAEIDGPGMSEVEGGAERDGPAGVAQVSGMVAGVSRRERWVKGALPNPTTYDSYSYINDDGGSSDSNDSNCESGGIIGDSRIGGGVTHVAADMVSRGGGTAAGDERATADADAWLETATASMTHGTMTEGGNNTTSHKRNKARKSNINDDTSTSTSTSSSGGGIGATKAGGGKKKKAKGKGSKVKGKGSKAKAKANKASFSKSTSTNDPANGASTFSNRVQKVKDKSALNVVFGEVSLLEFTRDVGGCAVPSEGAWTLSLGLPFRETKVNVDCYEASKAEILAERAMTLSKKQRQLATGETRQFDHRPGGQRNPLFDRLDEKERSRRLLDYACFHKSDLEAADGDDHHISDKYSHGIKSRGDSDELSGRSELSVFSHKVSHSDFVNKSHEAGMEVAAHRSSRRATHGCSCACVRADKLNVAKLKGELSKRGLRASGSKKELIKILQEAMQREDEEQGGEGHKVCRSDDCQCVMDGVECHADLCSCCKGPNINIKIGKKDAQHGGNCGNPEGIYAYSRSLVEAYRKPYVTAANVRNEDKWLARPL